ncbi:hypothetical protein LEP1GSC202_0968 [Leptospira yanagawae serovar Saopaulo str. Sao Paulo = ATCC 700523]|uniref:Uncharacterized protein n=1 Tax=Leptospira yanagawae serovar Saopaulo str. Sao Paulo = ATCC 700523 TaxID=1249483 RepID=A0A5E8HDA9_9LEPT|nr:hypothetical protein LEP1GSC202_0968 [Leptospira yanagawae serovar Saopaulo str. Sao Paulo = ATCC 700523]
MAYPTRWDPGSIPMIFNHLFPNSNLKDIFGRPNPKPSLKMKMTGYFPSV